MRGNDLVELAYGRIDADEDSSHIGDSKMAEYDPYVHSDGRPNEVCWQETWLVYKDVADADSGTCHDQMSETYFAASGQQTFEGQK